MIGWKFLFVKSLLSIAGGDEHVGQQLYNKFKDQDNLGDITAALINSKGASRISEGERLVVGDVLFPTHGLKRDEFQQILKSGDYSKLLSDTATKGTSGYRVTGDISEIRVAGAGEKTTEHGFVSNRDEAFALGYDLFRNINGTFSVNPASQILAESTARRLPNNLIIDFENGGNIVDKATPGLADLATRTKQVVVRGDTVMAGDLKPIHITSSFNPISDNYLEVQARYIWAQEQKNIRWETRIIHERDLPLLERAYYDGKAAEGFRIRMDDGQIVAGQTGERLKQFIESQKYKYAQELNGKPLDEISLRLNVSEKWLLGEKDEIAKIRSGVNYNTPRYGRIDYPDNIRAMDQYNAATM
jgi:hypothetical protein